MGFFGQEQILKIKAPVERETANWTGWSEMPRDGEKNIPPFKQVTAWILHIEKIMHNGKENIEKNILNMFERIEFTGGNGS